MKKFLLSLVALMAFGTSAWADGITIPNVDVRQGKSGVLQIILNVDTKKTYSSISADIQLPEGITCDEMTFKQEVEEGVFEEKTGPKAELTDVTTGFSIASSYPNDGDTQNIRVLAFATTQTINYGEDGEFILLTIPFNASSELEIDSELNGTASNIHLGTSGGVDVEMSDASFVIKVIEDIITLDEESTEMPEIAENQKVKVIRTIKANEWSTLCLPFDMTADQVYEVFGDDVQLAYLNVDNGYSFEKDEEGNITNININFNSDDLSEDFTGNYPYIIKTSKDITEFELTVNVNPDDVKESWSKGKGSNKYSIEFIGTYKANTIVPENSLFLSGGNFWYSKGLTKMKAFRAYFNILHILADLSSSAGVKMQVNVNGTPTNINDLQIIAPAEGVFTVGGQKLNSDVSKLRKGVYIINGKKVAVK